jgi:hypothetical protein
MFRRKNPEILADRSIRTYHIRRGELHTPVKAVPRRTPPEPKQDD